MRIQLKYGLVLLVASLLTGCGNKTTPYAADTSASAATAPTATTSQQAPSPATGPTAATDTFQHHSKLKGALIGGAVGAVMGGKRGALAGAAAGAALQHERNKNERKKAGY